MSIAVEDQLTRIVMVVAEYTPSGLYDQKAHLKLANEQEEFREALTTGDAANILAEAADVAFYAGKISWQDIGYKGVGHLLRCMCEDAAKVSVYLTPALIVQAILVKYATRIAYDKNKDMEYAAVMALYINTTGPM